jgi:hypothetical protein
VYNVQVEGVHTYAVGAGQVLVHNKMSEAPIRRGAIGTEVPGGEHFAEWELQGPRGGLIASGDEMSGLDFSPKPGTKLSFPDQSWYGHTEGKIISDLMDDGKLAPGRRLSFSGELPPCQSCRQIMQWASSIYNMEIMYVDSAGNVWAWKNGVLIQKP